MAKTLNFVLAILAIFTFLSIVSADEGAERFSEKSKRKGFNPKIKKHSDEKKKREALNPSPNYVKRKDNPEPTKSTSSVCVSTPAPHPTKPYVCAVLPRIHSD